MTENRDIGNNYFKEKNYQDAIKYYSKAIELDSNDKLSYSNRSVSYLNIGEYKNALNDGMNIIKIDNKWAKGWNRLGNALEKLDDIENAKESYKKAIELEPDNLNYSNNLKRLDNDKKEDMNNMFNDMLKNMGNNGTNSSQNPLNDMLKNMGDNGTNSSQNPLNDMLKNTMNSEMGSNLFKDMLNNKELQKKFQDPNFMNKMSSNKDPTSLMQDPDIMNLANNIFTSMGPNKKEKKKEKKKENKEYVIDSNDETELDNIDKMIKDLDNINVNKDKLIDDDNSTEESL